jgi:hypothetical protein
MMSHVSLLCRMRAAATGLRTHLSQPYRTSLVRWYSSSDAARMSSLSSPQVFGRLQRASAAEYRAVASDAFFAMHRPLLGYRPNESKSLFTEDEHMSEQHEDEQYQYMPFELSPPVGNPNSVVARVLPITSDEAIWYMENSMALERAEKLLKIGDETVRRNATMYATSIKRKRKKKMNKHKHRKLRKRTRALRKRLGKI